MSEAQGIRLKNPPHPGEFVKFEIVEALNLSTAKTASLLEVAHSELTKMLSEQVPLSSELALRIEKVFGVSMDTLMRMQNSYDIAQARNREDEINLIPFEWKSA